MDHAHFGLQKALFGDGIAADSAVFRSPKHDQVIAHFGLALRSPNAALVLRGPAGIGKTTLTAATLRAASTRLALAWLNGTPTNATELLELVLVELGINTVRTTRIERLQLWRQFQAETRATESRLFVVVERTEDLSTDVLHALDQLTAPDAAGNPGANLVLLGHQTIDEHLAAPLLESLRQRIRVRADLTPFTEAELQNYLRHQVACAGGHYDRIFAPGTAAALYRYSGGVARLLNTLCETALDFAASQQQPLLTPDLVTKTAVSLLGLAEVGAPSRAPALRERAAAGPAAHQAAAAAAVSSATSAPSATAATSAAPTGAPTLAASPAARAPAAVASPAPAAAPAAPAAAVATAAPAPAPAVVPVATTAPGPAATVTPRTAAAAAPTTPRPAAVPAPPVAATRPAAVELEFDGGATDISDVAVADFPVLTDAVEPTSAAPSKRSAKAPRPPAEPASRAAGGKPAAAVQAPVEAPAPKPVAPAATRVETAYAAPKPTPAPPAPTQAPAAKPAPAAPPVAATASSRAAPPPRAPAAADDDDLLRQTQTMRAIAVAKSIDDISSSMAETLFGDAELDLVKAALASAADWPDDDELSAPAAAEPAGASAKSATAKHAGEPQPAKAAEPVDDPFDLFGLGDDAPLELMDDSTLPPVAPKTVAR